MEGRRPHQTLDRSLSQSFAEEKKLLSNKYKTDPAGTVPEETIDDVEEDLENGGDEVRLRYHFVVVMYYSVGFRTCYYVLLVVCFRTCYYVLLVVCFRTCYYVLLVVCFRTCYYVLLVVCFSAYGRRNRVVRYTAI